MMLDRGDFLKDQGAVDDANTTKMAVFHGNLEKRIQSLIALFLKVIVYRMEFPRMFEAFYRKPANDS